jgi:hypothetical protein
MVKAGACSPMVAGNVALPAWTRWTLLCSRYAMSLLSKPRRPTIPNAGADRPGTSGAGTGEGVLEKAEP